MANLDTDVKTAGMPAQAERRKLSQERRRNEVVTQFPIITTQGICVRSERRKIPDRRMSNIVVRQAHIRADVFDILFGKFTESERRGNLRSLRQRSPANTPKEESA